MDDETKARKSNPGGDKPKRARRKSRIAGYRPKPKIRTARAKRETPADPPKEETRAAVPVKEETPASPSEEETAAASPEKETPAARPKRRPRTRPRPKLRRARPRPKIRARAAEETPAAPAGEEAPAARPKRRPRPARPKPKIRARTKSETTADSTDGETPAARPKPKARTARPAGKRPVRKRPLRKRPLRKRRPRKARKKGPSYEDLKDDALLEGLKKQFPGEILSGQSFLGQSIYTVKPGVLYDVMLSLRDHSESPFDYMIDISALDYLGDQERFLMVYQIYSYATKRLLRVKSRFAEGDPVPSMTSIWKTADWLEREVYDMFGILFSGHPDLKRILLPDDWHGFPLRKDYDIKLQDQSWIRNHLKIRKTPD
ncbi:MAG: NADH-quinone oxidoreductase subunit C [Candidatus Aminicenantes bacterium]|nr:NADH-quinone oxidoreductase subunit C [Candidatus Aminicenantes bacterium]